MLTDTSYHLTVNIQTPKGMLEIGRFFLGTDKSFAEDTVNELKGSDDLVKYPSIRLDLLNIESNKLPVCLKSIGCTLEQYASNCKVLTREAFRYFMFEKSTLE